MTTILFDPIERALYTDSQSTSGSTVVSYGVKKMQYRVINGIGGCLLAIAGDPYCGEMLLRCINKEEHFTPEDDDDSAALIILDKKGVIYDASTDRQTVMKVADQKDCVVNGSGAWDARAVYLATQDPVKSMEIAKQMDVYSGGRTFKAKFSKGLPVFTYID